MSTDPDPITLRSCKYAIKIFEPYLDTGHVLDVPLPADGGVFVDDELLREEISSFVFEQLESGSNVPFEYAVRSGTQGNEIWLTLGEFKEQASTIKSQAFKEEIESLNKRHASKVKSLESRLEAELLTKAVEYEEKEIALQKEVIELRIKHAKDTTELRDKVTEYEEKIRLLESKLTSLESNSISP